MDKTLANNVVRLQGIQHRFQECLDSQTPIFVDNNDSRNPQVQVITLDYVGTRYAKGHAVQLNEDLGEVQIPQTILYADALCKNESGSSTIIVKGDTMIG